MTFPSSVANMGAVLAWVLLCVGVWWVGYSQQVRLTRRVEAIVKQPPGWLAMLCGVHPGGGALHVPLAAMQVTAIASAVAGSSLILFLGPEVLQRSGFYLLSVTFAAYLVGEMAIFIRRLIRRR